MKKGNILAQIEKLGLDIKKADKITHLLHERAELYTSIQEYGKAINDYLRLIEINADDKIAIAKLSILRNILKYSNIDIYASTNTNMDPWLD